MIGRLLKFALKGDNATPESEDYVGAARWGYRDAAFFDFKRLDMVPCHSSKPELYFVDLGFFSGVHSYEGIQWIQHSFS